MTTSDYMPLVKRIRLRLRSWTGRYLSYAARLQLLRLVIGSIVNVWINTYRLPNGCVKELEKMCSWFLWSGPDLKATKAKLACEDVCKPKVEGGLVSNRLKRQIRLVVWNSFGGLIPFNQWCVLVGFVKLISIRTHYGWSKKRCG